MQVITFNSYKGGACRTTTCYNALPYLAQKLGATSDCPILVFDIDLDSMGLTNIFQAKLSNAEKNKKRTYSAKNLFVEDSPVNHDVRTRRMKSVREDDWYFSLFDKIGNDLGLSDDGCVLFCGADKNAASISDDDYLRFADASPLLTLLQALRNMPPDKQPKAVILDCASGVQMSTVSALKNTDCAVMCMRPTMQFRMGTRDYLLTQIPGELKNHRRRKARRIILLPTAVAQINVSANDPNKANAEKELASLKKKTFETIQYRIIDDIIEDDSDLGYELVTDMIDGEVKGIPEIERFKWEEGLLYTLDEWTEQEKILKRQYERLADVIIGE